MIIQFVLIALATLASEDLTCIATGVLIAQGQIGFAAGTAACFAGILLGDLMLFLVGRIAGRPAMRWRPLGRMISADRVDRASDWLARRGMAVVLLSRFTPGLRLPTYFAAGLLRTRFWAFAFHFALASAVWTPLLVGSTALLGRGSIETLLMRRTAVLPAFVLVVGGFALLLHTFRALLNPGNRRRLWGFLLRKVRWEFWPIWAAYLPLVPYWIYLALRYRSLTLFTAANPGIPSGGLVGESKSQILAYLRRVEGAVAAFDLIAASLEPAARVERIRCFMHCQGLAYPVVLKPDIGERGSGVAIVRTDEQLEEYARRAPADFILQRYVDGVEFGIYYVRYPDDVRGRILSITEKRFPTLTGDGHSRLIDLILNDPRAICLASTYSRLSRRPIEDVPAAGEQVQLVEIGSHCRGAIFVDAIQWNSPALEGAIDRVSQAHPGFHIGRFDVRAPSAGALAEGRFQVIELNGVSSEATHVYDPRISLLDAYRVMFTHWRMAFEIGAEHRRRGVRPMGAGRLLKLAYGRQGNSCRCSASTSAEHTNTTIARANSSP